MTVFVLACGARKRSHPAPARDLYTGSLFRAGLGWVDSVAGEDDDVFILSALHGLVPQHEVVEPYNLRLGGPGSVMPTRLLEQARARGLLQQPVIVVGGQDYVRLARMVWPRAAAPFGREAGHRGMFEMMSAMREQRGVPA